jgi:hypothetical protein
MSSPEARPPALARLRKLAHDYIVEERRRPAGLAPGEKADGLEAPVAAGVGRLEDQLAVGVEGKPSRPPRARSNTIGATSASPAPTMADFFTCLTGPASAHPFAENGFTINPPQAFTLAGVESLHSDANWSWVVARISTMAFLFSSQPVGGVRMAIVPRDPAYPWLGMARARGGAAAPSFLIQAGLAETCTHELGHAAGLLHANCGGAAGPYGGLPLNISDPGLDVMARRLVPSGSWEAMSYCGPQWPSVPHYGHMFKSIPFA